MTITVESPELVLHSSEATWDREQWDTLPNDGKRYEIIDGVLYMSTVPSPWHQWISRQTQRLLYSQIDDRGLGITFNAPVGLFMPGCDPVQPDLLVLRPEDRDLIMERRIETIPLLLVEILSPSNPQHDLILKRQAYARADVPARSAAAVVASATSLRPRGRAGVLGLARAGARYPRPQRTRRDVGRFPPRAPYPRR